MHLWRAVQQTLHAVLHAKTAAPHNAQSRSLAAAKLYQLCLGGGWVCWELAGRQMSGAELHHALDLGHAFESHLPNMTDMHLTAAAAAHVKQ